MILGLSRKDNGKSLSVKGFYSVRYRQSWSFQDGSGIPDSRQSRTHVWSLIGYTLLSSRLSILVTKMYDISFRERVRSFLFTHIFFS